MTRLWIDLTDLERWSGHHGGIQRVVYGIAHQYFLHQDSLDREVAFFSYSSIERDFRQAHFEPIHQRVQGLAAERDHGGPGSRLGQRISTSMPGRLRRSEVFMRGVRKLARSAIRGARYTERSLGGRRRRGSSTTAAATFHAQDTVLVMGKPWDDLNIQGLLSERKAASGFRLVQIIHDLIPPLQPHLHDPALLKSFTQHMTEAIRASDLMLTVSQSTARDLKTFCEQRNLKVPSVHVIRNGDVIADLDSAAAGGPPDERMRQDFIATVGTIEIRKNHMLLYYTYKLAQENGIDLPQLVIVGGRGWLTSDFQYLIQHDRSLKESIIVLDDVSDAELSWIYANCLFTVYPSMYEGWGLPVAESVAYGKLCLSSRASSMPEIAGDLIEYFSPYDSRECLDQLVAFAGHSDERAKRETWIAERYTPTTWRDTWVQVEQALLDLD